MHVILNLNQSEFGKYLMRVIFNLNQPESGYHLSKDLNQSFIGSKVILMNPVLLIRRVTGMIKG